MTNSADAKLEDDATIAEVERTLEELHRNPTKVLDRLPEKQRGGGRPASGAAFSSGHVAAGRHVIGSDRYRKGHSMLHNGVIISLSEVLPGRAPFEGNDRAENLVDTLRYRRLDQMHDRKLRKAKLARNPWSDDYWPLYLGVLGRRYADPGFPSSRNWSRNRDYIEDHPAPDIVAGGNATALARLSPSEKYDLLVGDPSGTLTTQMWEQGRYYHDRDGQVETWMGICHGWAPAAYMLPRPRKAVDVLAADGSTTLRFFPSDIKGLASLLWAQVPTVTRFIGGRTNDKDPPTDDNGRLTSHNAFDTNPGTWHMSVVNQIGVAKRSFIIDATYDYEVWNQPVDEYRYSYFNPKTRKFSSSLEEAMVDYDDFRDEDEFSRYRSRKVKKIVGVMMKLSYMVETSPTHDTTDSDARDARSTVKYLYDLELDDDTEILGGEWYQNRHPDFLWTPPPGTRARSSADAYATGTWSSASTVLPSSWRSAARHASRGGAPLGKVVERLIDFAGG